MDMGTSQGSLYEHDLAWLASRAVYYESSYIRSWTAGLSGEPFRQSYEQTFQRVPYKIK